ncbi:MAG: hypothetical protein ABI867_17710 [Kofleriaceae bacterium]
MVSREDDADHIDWAVEWKLRAIAVPVAFALALVFHASPAGHALQRTFLTMIPHELGHAVTAWLSGHSAIPSLWRTAYFGTSVIVIVVVAAGNAALAWRGWTTRNNILLAAGLALGALQLTLTTSTAAAAESAFTFGGDGGAMVIGTLLVLAFFAPPGSRLRFGGVRWGLLVIGAATVVDTFATWWTARTDRGAIPFGEIEGVGLSDPSKLQSYGWSVDQIVERYVLLGGGCILAIAGCTAWFVYTARRDA